MTTTLINKTLVFLLVFTSVSAFAQEKIFDLNVNARLNGYEEYLRQSENVSRAADTLSLPFFDDFSESFSRIRTLGDDYPDPNLWDGNTVYINNHMAINPISQGVATFDGLDERGQAYSFGFSVPAVADSLTSNCLRMSGVQDTAYLSFYYQAQGLGNAPEQDNPLVVEFKDTSQVWTQVWDVEGYNLDDFDFRRAIIPVAGDEYLFDGFQFRFLNYASLSGNVDHWHVDYVKLDVEADTTIDDVAFLAQTSIDYQGNTLNATSSVLKEYNNMPWVHFKTDPSEFLGDTTYFALRNNRTLNSPDGDYTPKVFDHEGNLLHVGDTASPNVFPSIICGNEPNNCAETIGGVEDNHYVSLNYDLPTNIEISSDSMFFEIVHEINGLNDDVTKNDRISHQQLFYNYYAYDDGTAEQAYGLGELETVGRVAVKYDIKDNDVLQAIQLYLNPVAFDLSDEPVQLAVWSGGETPDDTLWTSQSITLNYTNAINYFYHYFLDRDIQVNDNSTIFIGWIQQPATNQKFSIGMDRRTDNSDKVFYNLGGTWQQSSIPGSLMIRPVFGEEYDWVGVENVNPLEDLLVYPNPSNGQVSIQEKFVGQLAQANIQVFDMSGRTIHQQVGCQNALDLQSVQQGVYLLRIETDGGLFTQRLILQ